MKSSILIALATFAPALVLAADGPDPAASCAGALSSPGRWRLSVASMPERTPAFLFRRYKNVDVSKIRRNMLELAQVDDALPVPAVSDDTRLLIETAKFAARAGGVGETEGDLTLRANFTFPGGVRKPVEIRGLAVPRGDEPEGVAALALMALAAAPYLAMEPNKLLAEANAIAALATKVLLARAFGPESSGTKDDDIQAMQNVLDVLRHGRSSRARELGALISARRLLIASFDAQLETREHSEPGTRLSLARIGAFHPWLAWPESGRKGLMEPFEMADRLCGPDRPTESSIEGLRFTKWAEPVVYLKPGEAVKVFFPWEKTESDQLEAAGFAPVPPNQWPKFSRAYEIYARMKGAAREAVISMADADDDDPVWLPPTTFDAPESSADRTDHASRSWFDHDSTTHWDSDFGHGHDFD